MENSREAFSKWLDRDFFKLGAFLTTYDQKFVTFGKGGKFLESEELLDSHETIFYLKNFYQNKYLAYQPDSVIEVPIDDVRSLLQDLPEPEADLHSLSTDDEIYKKDFYSLQNSFKNNLQKVVLVSRTSFVNSYGEKTSLRLLEKSFSFGAGMPYGVWNDKYGVIGSTPELLYQVNGNNIETVALAGTARQGEAEKLIHSEKDRQEHNLVIQDIHNKLKEFTSHLKTHETVIYPYKSIIHLRTDLTGEIKDNINFTHLTNQLSPTAALGGYPQAEALHFLKSSQYARKYPERYFGSCFGMINHKIKQFIVSIRNVQWQENQIFIESGGGVLPESVLEKEMDEIELKRSAIQKHYL